MKDIDKAFRVSESNGAARTKAIRDLLKIHPLDVQWMLPSQVDQNPMVWMIQVNGLLVDARNIPREIQEQAFRKGLIPYIPDDHLSDSEEK
jgi:hypothetical protein